MPLDKVFHIGRNANADRNQQSGKSISESKSVSLHKPRQQYSYYGTKGHCASQLNRSDEAVTPKMQSIISHTIQNDLSSCIEKQEQERQITITMCTCPCVLFIHQ